MRILSITAQKPHSTGSGVYLTELVKSFHAMGHEQMVIAGMYKEDTAEFPEGVGFVPVYFQTEELPFAVTGMSDEMPYESTRYREMTEDMGERFEDVFGRKVTRIAAEFSPDIILCHHLYFLTALVRRLCPDRKVAGICHGSDLRQVKKNTWKQQEIIRGIRHLDVIFALHDVQKQEIMNIYGIGGDKVRVIGTGYNNEVFYPAQTDMTGTVRKGRILFAGKISEKKGVKSLLKSFAHLEDTAGLSLTLAGGSGMPKEQRAIEALAETCPLPVRFAGRLPQNKLADEMRSSQVFVLPSFYEGLPLVVIEALACGQKAVCTKLPGIKEWLDCYLPHHGVVFVEPPQMRHEDEPFAESLPAFERRLADALTAALFEPGQAPEGLEELSWKGICQKILF